MSFFFLTSLKGPCPDYFLNRSIQWVGISWVSTCIDAGQDLSVHPGSSPVILMNIRSLDSDGSGGEVRLVTLHSLPSLKTKSSASHVIISLMAWSSSAMKDEYNLLLKLPLILPSYHLTVILYHFMWLFSYPISLLPALYILTCACVKFALVEFEFLRDRNVCLSFIFWFPEFWTVLCT